MKAVSFKNFHVLVSAPPVVPASLVGGYADGDDVAMMERREDSATDVVGADGQMSVSISTDKSGSMKFKLMQTSKTNRVFNTICNLQEGGPTTFAPIFVVAQDTYRQDMATGTFGYLKKKPPMTRGKKANEQEWEIVVERLDLVFGDPVFAGLSTAAAEAAI